MLDAFHAGRVREEDLQVFVGSGAASGVIWQVWNRPRGVSMISIFCMGGGGGGGGGLTGAAASARGGGGGGGSGAIVCACGPLILLPDVLYIQAGAGGAGQGSGSPGTNGQRSFVSVKYGSVNAADLVLVSGAAAAIGGAAGTATTAAGGAAETIATTGLAVLQMLGAWNACVGMIGAAGGSGAGSNPGANSAALSINQGCGGAGGGSCPIGNTSNAGGNITGAGLIPSIAGGTTGASVDGTSGWRQLWPFLSSGGSGGGGTNAQAGKGGNAGYGSGGGGGGGGTTGGVGGRGGHGIVIVSCW